MSLLWTSFYSCLNWICTHITTGANYREIESWEKKVGVTVFFKSWVACLWFIGYDLLSPWASQVQWMVPIVIPKLQCLIDWQQKFSPWPYHDLETLSTLLAPLWGKSTCQSPTKVLMEFRCYHCHLSEHAVEQTSELPVIWDTMNLMWHYNWLTLSGIVQDKILLIISMG